MAPMPAPMIAILGEVMPLPLRGFEGPNQKDFRGLGCCALSTQRRYGLSISRLAFRINLGWGMGGSLNEETAQRAVARSRSSLAFAVGHAALFRPDGRNARPFVHLNAGHELVTAVGGTKDRGFTF